MRFAIINTVNTDLSNEYDFGVHAAWCYDLSKATKRGCQVEYHEEPNARAVERYLRGDLVTGGFTEEAAQGFAIKVFPCARRRGGDYLDSAQDLVSVLKALDPGGCREWVGMERCSAPSEFLLWGRLLAAEALGPRCYDHAAQYVGHAALGDPSYAIMDLRPLRRAIARESEQA